MTTATPPTASAISTTRRPIAAFATAGIVALAVLIAACSAPHRESHRPRKKTWHTEPSKRKPRPPQHPSHPHSHSHDGESEHHHHPHPHPHLDGPSGHHHPY